MELILDHPTRIQYTRGDRRSGVLTLVDQSSVETLSNKTLGSTCDVSSATGAGGAAKLIVLGLPATNPLAINTIGSNLQLGDTDVYTCPTGRKCIIQNFGAIGSATIGTTTYFPEHKQAGVYYRLRANLTVGQNVTVNSAASLVLPIILNAGESISVNVATVAGMSLYVRGIEFDDTYLGKTVWLHGLSSGDNLLYTAPATKGTVNLATSTGAFFVTNIGIISDAGGNRNYLPKINSIATDSASTINANVAGTIIGFAALAPNDSVKVNVDTGAAGQTAFITILELT